MSGSEGGPSTWSSLTVLYGTCSGPMCLSIRCLLFSHFVAIRGQIVDLSRISARIGTPRAEVPAVFARHYQERVLQVIKLVHRTLPLARNATILWRSSTPLNEQSEPLGLVRIGGQATTRTERSLVTLDAVSKVAVAEAASVLSIPVGYWDVRTTLLGYQFLSHDGQHYADKHLSQE
eukprot:CAMPEP_0117467088 /NCGR_PEP_ID=MMETSP0784-20121206/5475_1 /TAXON_ID=39447 /ORGANISM="" /LENGTH=176 /DNA_ID=CAMNT_0005261045 /DNA_START=453 /DNA_END=980 /DNA_ORIENTATION=+